MVARRFRLARHRRFGKLVAPSGNAVLRQDARRGKGGRVGIDILPVDVLHSDWDNTLEGGHERRGIDDGGQAALRLGFRQVAGLSEEVGDAITAARTQRMFTDVRDLCLRARLDEKAGPVALIVKPGVLA